MSVTIRDTMTDPALFGSQFAGDSFTAWRALLAGFYGLPLDDAEAKHWKALTRRETPTQAHDELWLVIGRRGGKSQATALLAVFEAAFKDYTDRLAPGEMATVLVVSVDRKAARAVFRYVVGLLRSNPMLERMIVREDRESVELSNRTIIEIGTASFRSTRGMTYAFVCIDEIAFLRSEDSANPDRAIVEAIRPGLASLQGKLVALSSPYAKKGELFQAYKRYFGKQSSILVAQASSRYMNPGLPERVVTEAYERDPESAKSEYGGANGAEFRSDLEQFVTPEIVDGCTVPGRYELPPVEGIKYTSFCDPSGGTGKDNMTLAIAHREDEGVVIDALRVVKPPFSPEQTISDFASLLKEYRCTRVTGDRFAGGYPRELFRKHSIEYCLSDRPASDIFRDALPLLNSGRVELPEHKQLRAELINLERRTARSGKDTISHPVGQHDDAAVACMGACIESNKPTATPRVRSLASDGDPVRGRLAAAKDTARRGDPFGLDEGGFF